MTQPQGPPDSATGLDPLSVAVCGVAAAAGAGEFLVLGHLAQVNCGQTSEVELALVAGLAFGGALGLRWWSPGPQQQPAARRARAWGQLTFRLAAGGPALLGAWFWLDFGSRLWRALGVPGDFAPVVGSVLVAGLAAVVVGLLAGTACRAAGEVFEDSPSRPGSPLLPVVLAALVGGLLGAAAAEFVLIERWGFLRLGGAALGLRFAATLLAWTGLGLADLAAARKAPGGTTPPPPPAPAIVPPGPSPLQPRLAVAYFAGGALVAAFALASARALASRQVLTVYFQAADVLGAGLALAVGLWLAWQTTPRSGLRSLWGATSWLTSLACLLPVVLGDPRWNVTSWWALAGTLPAWLGLGWLAGRALARPHGPALAETGRYLAAGAGGVASAVVALRLVVLPHFDAAHVLIAAGLLVSLPGWAGFDWRPRSFVAGAAWLALVLLVVLRGQSLEQFARAEGCRVFRDGRLTAVVLGEPHQPEAGLAVGGVGRARASRLDKVGVHLAGSLCREAPRRALVLGPGLGTAMRSAASWGVAVEVVDPSPAQLAVVRGGTEGAPGSATPPPRLVVDDPRRWLRQSGEAYDLILVDPPRPIEAPGSRQVLTQEFWALARSRLSPIGVLHLGMPECEPAVGQAVLAALVHSFPYVRVFLAHEGRGMHYLASIEPLAEISPGAMQRRLPAAAQADLLEWSPQETLASLTTRILKWESPPATLLGDVPPPPLADDRPGHEYYLLRRGTLAAAQPTRARFRAASP